MPRGFKYRGEQERTTELSEDIARATREGDFLPGVKARGLGRKPMLTDPSEKDLRNKKLDTSRLFAHDLLPVLLDKPSPTEVTLFRKNLEEATKRAARLGLVARTEQQRGARLTLKSRIGRERRTVSITDRGSDTHAWLNAVAAQKIKTPVSVRLIKVAAAAGRKLRVPKSDRLTKNAAGRLSEFETQRAEFVWHVHQYLDRYSEDLIRRSWDAHIGKIMETGTVDADYLRGLGRAILSDAAKNARDEVRHAINTGEIAHQRNDAQYGPRKARYFKFFRQLLGKNKLQ